MPSVDLPKKCIADHMTLEWAHWWPGEVDRATEESFKFSWLSIDSWPWGEDQINCVLEKSLSGCLTGDQKNVTLRTATCREGPTYRSGGAKVPLAISQEASSSVLGEKGFSRKSSKQRGQSIGCWQDHLLLFMKQARARVLTIRFWKFQPSSIVPFYNSWIDWASQGGIRQVIYPADGMRPDGYHHLILQCPECNVGK